MKITPANGPRATGQDQQVIAAAAPSPKHRQIATIAFLFIAFFLMVFWGGKSFGQAAGDYDVDQLHPKLKDEQVIKQLDSIRKGMARRRNVDTDSREWKMFRAYYTAYIFRRMTIPEARGELSGIVSEILRDLNRAQRNNATAAPAILQWSRAEAGRVASGNYHPAARINATILLGHLDDKPEDNSSGTPPTPSVTTLKPLRALWENENNPDGVRAAALQGLRRWVAYGFQQLPADEKKAIQDSMFQLAASDPPAGRDRAGHGFMQRYAVDILYVLNDENSAQKLTDTLLKLSSDRDADPVIAFYAAQKLARLGDELQPIAKPADVAKAWSSKAADFFGQQSLRLAKMERPEPVPDQPEPIVPSQDRRNRLAGGGDTIAEGGGMAAAMQSMGDDTEGGEVMSGMGDNMATMMGPGGARGADANPQPIEVIAIRRKLNHALQSLKYGLTGSASMEPAEKPAGVVQATTDADRAALEQLVDAIAAAVENVNDPQYDTREKFAEMVAEEAGALRKLTRQLGGDPTDPDAAPSDFDEPSSPDVAFANPSG